MLQVRHARLNNLFTIQSHVKFSYSGVNGEVSRHTSLLIIYRIILSLPQKLHQMLRNLVLFELWHSRHIFSFNDVRLNYIQFHLLVVHHSTKTASAKESQSHR